jgi:uncharacterized protein YhbP (UPF0306 family)
VDHLYQSGEIRRQALTLIKGQRTMVLATTNGDIPWTAPVYYVYIPPNFYFFSSPKARHILQAGPDRSVAASIFVDSVKWREIQGLQMCGTLLEEKKKTARMKAVAHFLIKFPFAKPFLQPDDTRQGEAPNVAERVKLYTFTPEESYYVNNRFGFGKRLSVVL